MNKKQLFLVIRVTIAIIVVFFLYRAIQDARETLDAESSFSVGELKWGWLFVAGASYALGLIPMGIYWYRLLHAFGQQPKLGATLAAFFIGHLGKYVPGKAMVVVLRTGMLKGSGVNPTVTAVSVFAETLTMMAVGAFLAAFILAVSFADQLWLMGLAITLMLCSGIPTWPPIFRWLVKRLRVTKLDPILNDALEGYTVKLVMLGWFANLAGWFLLGFSLWATLCAIPMVPPVGSLPETWLPLTATVCLAIVAGFLSLLPGGIGVRELVLDELMVDSYGQVTAIVSAVLLRVIWLMTELVISGILYMWTKNKHQ